MSALDVILSKHDRNCEWENLPERDRNPTACVCLTIQSRNELADLRSENERLKKLSDNAASLIKNIVDDELWEHAQLWLKQYGAKGDENGK